MTIPKIKIFTTGGSIDKYYATHESAFVVGEPAIAGALVEANVTIDYEIESLLKKDSLELTDDDRQMIFERVAASLDRYIVITHGTDTMIQTARVLTSITDKVIVLTGAMQPAAFKQTDAVFNVGGAIIAAQALPTGVYLVMNGRIFTPDGVRKNVTMDRFEDV
ncbi:MAG TPA: asparaginase [Chloroflexi bacterium]|nr:asparaginase [Chloroflexota bacterium]